MSAVLGLIIAIVLGMMALPSYMNLQNTASENIRVANAAGQLKKVADAAQGYIQNNYAVIQGAATATTPATITPAMLQSTGFLDASFQNSNPYQQDYIVKVLQPTAGVLQALVLTQNGQSIPQKTAPAIATQVGGAEGGFVPYPGQYGSLSPSVAQGAYSAWQVSLTNYGSPGAGHLAALLSFSNGQLQNNYLYRVAMPGNPSLNQMQTNLDMGNNNVNNAATVSATTVTASGNVNANQVQLNGVVSENTACSPNGLVARDANGLLLSCQSGSWKRSASAGGFSGISFYADWRWINSLNVDVGWHKFCTLSGQVQNSFTTLTPAAGPDSNSWYDWVYWSGYDGSIVICYR